MRVRLFEPNSEAETAALLAVERGIRQFWSRFSRVHYGPAVEWMGELRQLLKEVCPGLGLEADGRAGKRVLYILPVDGLEYTPLAQKVVASSPLIEGWTFDVWRPALALDAALARVSSGSRLDLGAARARVGIERGHALAVVLGHHLFRGADDVIGGGAAETLVSSLVGDALFERWVSSVSVVTAARPSPLKLVGQEDKALPLSLSELGETLQTAVARIIDTLPESPLHEFCERADWVLFEMDGLEEPGEHPLPALRVATTMCPEMLKCFLSGAPFASERFSRHGERFAYVELDTTGQAQDASLDLRNSLEEALDYALVPGRLGCVVGAGVGDGRMYLFLALHSLEAAIRLIVRSFQEYGVRGRARLEFCDDEWRHEWVD